ncbi:hypothetical protein [Rhizobium hainanense]|uniref:Uncharacterized protein n=1 Tax=Rhizobium hainanense TaxID=52131 RepID=A0A1C3VBG3_9HYPH|nr:hypothetical protein [Rhizobium hainanense]SCB25019.1 hypothetical protein GA0061100_105207 [Rhizobium hainanense]
MKWNVISRLKTIFAGRALRDANGPIQPVDRPGSAERELSARDYEIYYWCTSPAPWY